MQCIFKNVNNFWSLTFPHHSCSSSLCIF